MIGGPNLRYVRDEPPLAPCTINSTTAVTQFTIILLSSVLEYIYSMLLSSPPPDDPWSGTESNLPVSHPTRGIQIVDPAPGSHSEHAHPRITK